MIHDLAPYPVMKDSGVPWLGPVPEHWDVKSLGSLTTSRSERNRPDLPLLSVVREKGVILRDRESKEENHNFIPDDLSNYKVVHEGDLVINKMKAWQGSMGLAPQDGIVSPAYFVFDFAIENRHYGQALLRSRPYVGFFAQASDGVRIGQWDLSITGMKRIPVMLPPPAEQAAIVRFLDHADRRIRKAIAAKQRLIKLLQEQKQVIIHQAVTRGLDPDVKLKPSGVEWLGDVPEHWGISRLKFESNRIVDCLHATPPYTDDGEFPAIRTADIEPGKVRLAQARRLSKEHYEAWTSRYRPVAGDILYSREGERFGIAATVPENVGLCISQRMMVFNIKKSVSSQYLMWQINCRHVYLQAALDTIGSAAPHVNVERIKNFEIVLPSLNEQQAIVQHIEAETAKLDQAIARAQAEISLLREYRIRLIADVVTGKLDVRQAAARLPEPEQDTLPDELNAGEGEGLEGEEELTGEEE
ncbi:hypothetical protein Dxin01_03971 [Deinococcus xinjiangensis]|uniref:Type I restriction modification DNA specificity domain-containing protein n=1 Tax=Deinococcus xinjiangensis TaxID=457454 RepID=A0ABP9VKL3_9DEIO